MKTNKVWLTLRFNHQAYSIEYWTNRMVGLQPKHHMKYRSVDVESDTFDNCTQKLKDGILKKYKL